MKSQEFKDIIAMGYVMLGFLALCTIPELIFNQKSWIQVLVN